MKCTGACHFDEFIDLPTQKKTGHFKFYFLRNIEPSFEPQDELSPSLTQTPVSVLEAVAAASALAKC